MRTSMTQTTSTTSTRTLTRASCTTCEHALRARSFVTPLDVVSHALHGSSVLESHPIRIVIHERFSLISPSSLLLRPDLHRPRPLLLSHAPRAAH